MQTNPQADSEFSGHVFEPVIYLGISFTATGWKGPFYPKGMLSADYLAF